MGREIRRVPTSWEHPKDEDGNYKPLYDQPYEEAIEEWIDDHYLWHKGEHPHQEEYDFTEKYDYFAEWQPPPDVDRYRKRSWTDEEATHYVMYENVSEGTPVTPAFETKEALIDHLVNVGTFWGKKYTRAAAKRFVDSGYAPSFVMKIEDGEAKMGDGVEMLEGSGAEA